MTFSEETLSDREGEVPVDDICGVEGTKILDSSRARLKSILGHVAFISPIAAGVIITHEVHSGTVPESIAATAGFLLSSAVVMARGRH